jgi:hypothetical protein
MIGKGVRGEIGDKRASKKASAVYAHRVLQR